MAKLSRVEIKLLKKLGVSEDETLDVSGYSSKKDREMAAKEFGAKVVYGFTPHVHCGFCLKTPSGNCIVCNPAYLTYYDRYQDGGVIYVAFSIEKGYIKIGVTKNIEKRALSLRKQNYGGFSDWVIADYLSVFESAGQIEFEIHKKLKSYQVKGEYYKDGKMQKSREIFDYPAEKAIREIRKLANKNIE